MKFITFYARIIKISAKNLKVTIDGSLSRRARIPFDSTKDRDSHDWEENLSCYNIQIIFCGLGPEQALCAAV